MLKLFECFSGYGTASFALKRLGIPYEIVGYSDIDKYANQCFWNNHWKEIKPLRITGNPPFKELGDVKLINPNELDDFDLLTGGFPCQAFSVAGKGLGELDPRGTLFWEIVRIAEVKKPRYMLLENVKGLTTKKHLGTFNKILEELKRIGYLVHWKVVNTKDYGIPQNRERVFFVCFREQADYDNFTWPNKEELKLFIKDILEPEPVDDKFYLKEHQVQKLLEGIEKKMKLGVSKTIRSGGRNSLTNKHEWDVIKTIDTNGNPIPNIPEIGEANRLYDTEGDTPSVKASAINVKSVQWDQSGKGHNSQEDRAYNADGVMCCIPNANPSNKVNIFALRSFTRNGTKEVDGERFQNPEFREDGCSNSLTSVEKDNMLLISSTQAHNSVITDGVSSTLPEAMGQGGGHTPMIVVNTQPRSENRPSLVNGTSSGGSGTIWKEDGTTYCIDTNNTQADGLSNEVMPTLTTELAHSTGRDFYRGSGEKIFKSTGIFRRLTPKECFRLQGFLKDEINLDGLSDTQKYKLCGNGQSVNVVAKIFERMFL